MAQIVWTEPALIDLDEIAEYIALDKPQAARKPVQEVFSKVEHLKQFLNSGRKPPELQRNARYRELVVKPFRIFYCVQEMNATNLSVQSGLNRVKISRTRRESIHGGSVPSIPAREGPENSHSIQPSAVTFELKLVPFVQEIRIYAVHVMRSKLLLHKYILIER